MRNLTEMLDKALPSIEKLPRAKQQAVGEALALYKQAKQAELEAMQALIHAIQHDHQYWVVEGRLGGGGQIVRRRFIGASGPDAEARARKAGFTRILHLSPVLTDGPQD